jgi:hypothetical protein
MSGLAMATKPKPNRAQAARLGFTTDEIDEIESHLETFSEGRWRYFATWQPRPEQLVVYHVGVGNVRVTLARRGDGTYDVVSEDGRVVCTGANLGAALDSVLAG